jgi:hypothetical protein
MRELLKIFESYGMPFSFPIWDENADGIVEVNGYKVTKPDFETIVPHGHVAVITMQSKYDFSKVREKLEKIGFIVLSLDGFVGLS